MVDVMGLRTGLLGDVVVIRHAESLVERDRSPAEWRLSAQGREFSYQLGACLISSGICRLVTSPEEKAVATATIVADVLGLGIVVDERLREVRRPWITIDFSGAVTLLFAG